MSNTSASATLKHVTSGDCDSTVTDHLVQRQIELELEMRAIGTAKFEKMINDARYSNRESETPYGTALLQKTVFPMVEKIKEFIALYGEKKSGSVHTSVPFLYVINNHELVAYQTSKIILDGLSTDRSPLRVALKIASALEDEVRLREFENKNVSYYRTLKRSLDKRSKHAGYRKRVLVFSMNKAGIHWLGWNKTDKVHLGMKLIELFIEATGFLKMETVNEKHKRDPQKLLATPEVIEWIQKKNASGSIMQPELLPMIVPPNKWTNPYNGGYLSKALPQFPLVKTRKRKYLEDLASLNIDNVYSAVNGIQETAWQINPEVFMVMQEFWNCHQEVGKDFSNRLLDEPPKPFDIDTNEESKKAWKRKVNEVKTANIKRTSKIIQVAKTLSIADKFKDEPEIYFPHQLDFRGRLYALPLFLNPQGPDFTKALLRFANGKPLGDQAAVDYLAVHGANIYGVDKVSYLDRVKWVEDNEDNILQSAQSPFDYLWWTKADKPWQFLAFCFEWLGFKIHGLDWVSKIPIALDGSCNGLQHFSAMLRDEVGGQATNLVPSDKPSDIYQDVADRVIELLKNSEDPLAKLWLQVGVTRKTTKRCVMTLPYGATDFAFKAFVQEHIEDIGMEQAFGEDYKNFKASKFLADLIYTAIKRTVVKAMETMSWLQDVARVISKDSEPIQWVTPSGFPVVQFYNKIGTNLLAVYLTGQRIRLRIGEELDTLDRKRQTQGISPNFVHSFDASALMETVNGCLSLGVRNFAMIHDSYGTIASDSSQLAQVLRESFVSLYRDKNVLEDMRRYLSSVSNIDIDKIPEPPKLGTLKLEDVSLSKYFFA